MFRVKKIHISELSQLEKSYQNKFSYSVKRLENKLKKFGYQIQYKYLYISKPFNNKNKIYSCELSVFPEALSKNGAKKQFKLKIIRVFLFEKRNTDNQMLEIKKMYDLPFKCICILLLKHLIHMSPKASRDNFFDFIIRVFFHRRVGELAYTFRGKNYQWVIILGIILLFFIIGIVSKLKEIDFLSSLGYGYY